MNRETALLIIDVQRDFCPGGALPVDGGDAVVGPLNALIKRAGEEHTPVYASRDWHPLHHVSFQEQGGPWPVHCVQDTPGAQFHPDLQLPANTVMISKGVRLDRDQLSAFDETGLTEHLKSMGIRSLWIGGLATEVCVRASVLDACQAGFRVVIPRQAIAAIDLAKAKSALEDMHRAGARIDHADHADYSTYSA